MQTLTLQQFTDLVTNPDNANNAYALQITQTGCPDCAVQSENIESILEPKYTQFAWLKLEVADETEVPLFAPRVVPSIIFFHGRNRLTEAHGMIQSFDSFSEFVDDLISYDINLDPAVTQPVTS